MTRSRDTANTQENVGGVLPPFTAGKNKIINGGMNIWQRGTSFTIAANTYTYTSDRWCFASGNSSSTISRDTSVPNTTFQYSAKVQRTSGNTGTGGLYFFQVIETANCYPLIGQTITVSYWAKAGANYAGTVAGFINTGTVADQGSSTALGSWTGNAQPLAQSSFTLSSTWTKYTFTGTISSTALEIMFGIVYTPTGTAGADDAVYITGVQVEAGSVATPFTTATGTIQGELAACQRYYFQTAASNGYFYSGFSYSSTLFFMPIPLPVPMRVSPTSLSVTASASDYRVVNGGSFVNCSSVPTLETAMPQTAMIRLTVASGLTTGYGGAGTGNSANAYFGLNAEL